MPYLYKEVWHLYEYSLFLIWIPKTIQNPSKTDPNPIRIYLPEKRETETGERSELLIPSDWNLRKVEFPVDSLPVKNKYMVTGHEALHDCKISNLHPHPGNSFPTELIVWSFRQKYRSLNSTSEWFSTFYTDRLLT